jgi:hypothetical protein
MAEPRDKIARGQESEEIAATFRITLGELQRAFEKNRKAFPESA